LAFARVVLLRPDIIVLDEATAALDPKSQDKLMERLVAQSDITLISVGHRPELESFHGRKLVLERRSGTARLVSDTELVAYKKGRGLFRRWLRQLVPAT
jgi:putative ATP-binding cassette transporter